MHMGNNDPGFVRIQTLHLLRKTGDRFNPIYGNWVYRKIDELIFKMRYMSSGPNEIRIHVTGIRTLGADHYTIGPYEQWQQLYR
jgi:hypothetical protein